MSSIDIEELETRAKEFKKLERLLHFTARYWLFFILIPFLLGTFLVGLFFNRTPKNWESLVFIFIGAVSTLAVAYYASMKMRKYCLKDQEWAKLYSASIVNTLSKYFKTDNTESKKDYRNDAIKTTREFINCIEERWLISNFQMVREEYWDTLSQLLGNLSSRIIPNLEHGEDSFLTQIQLIMMNFFMQLGNFKLDMIKNFNEQMLRLPIEKTAKIGRLDRLSNFFMMHRFLKHTSVGLILAFACGVFYYSVVTFLGISRDIVFGGALLIFTALLTIYFSREKKD
jgi:hypothetical protein